MWGGGGGLVEYRAALLASHGFVAFALEYLSPEEIKDIHVTYFEVKAFYVLNCTRRPEPGAQVV